MQAGVFEQKVGGLDAYCWLERITEGLNEQQKTYITYQRA